ncbi:MAG: polyprenyl synthetase family protein [Desulfurispora sp.]|uniref:polyprenyl synthetase family protein n=1 Tax=Desulfurispora sp. TaxID=3014275 RepID=UPI00404B8DFC
MMKNEYTPGEQRNFQTHFAALAGRVDTALEQLLPGEDTPPPVLHTAMRYSTLAGGKRLRPVLALAACEAVGGEVEQILPAACALELIHTYSLIHDDLPAMDNDDLRRGLPTCHIKFGEAMAILAGDALLTMAFELLSAPGLPVPPQRQLAVLHEVAVAAGSQGLVGGQVLDIQATGRETTPEELVDIHRRKTGMLIRAAVRLGAMLGGASSSQLAALTTYAEHFGLTFQIIDDILDITGDEQKLGKPVGSDQKNNKVTYVSLYGLEVARQKAQESRQQARAALADLGERAWFLRALVDFVISRDH